VPWVGLRFNQVLLLGERCLESFPVVVPKTVVVGPWWRNSSIAVICCIVSVAIVAVSITALIRYKTIR